MNQITDIIVSSAMGILTILAGIIVQEVKKYLIAKGGEKAVTVAEIVAKNAVNAVEQVAKATNVKSDEKLAQAKTAVLDELNKYNIYMTDDQLDVFIESAVKQMKDNWEGRHVNEY